MTEIVKWDAEATDSAARVEYVEDGISITIAARTFEGGSLSVDGTTIPWAMVGPVIEGIGRVMAAKDRGDSAPCRHEQGFWHTGGIDRCPDCGIAATGDEDMEPEQIAQPPEVVEVDGVTFRAHPEHGCFYELDDPDPNGTIGRLWMPMNLDGTPDVGSLGAIEVRYEDA